jgi:DNA-binding PadR family transcriptional regulator
MKEEIYKEIKRSFLKYIVLKIIKDKPIHGYEIIKTVELLSKGQWTPSAGSIYPILESLESKDFIQSEDIDRRKVYSITPEGMAALDHMTQEKLELLKEMSRLINIVIESNDNKEVGCDAGNIQVERQQPEATQETCDEGFLTSEKDE